MNDIVTRLEAVIADRRTELAANPEIVETSYVARQLARGRPRLAQKLGEEAVETAIAAVIGDDAALVAESADLLFHLLLLLGERGLPFDAVLAELARREGLSGLEEKAGRMR